MKRVWSFHDLQPWSEPLDARDENRLSVNSKLTAVPLRRLDQEDRPMTDRERHVMLAQGFGVVGVLFLLAGAFSSVVGWINAPSQGVAVPAASHASLTE